MRSFLGSRVRYRVLSTLKKCSVELQRTRRSRWSFPDEEDSWSRHGLDDTKNQYLHGWGHGSGKIMRRYGILTDCLGPLVSGAITCAKAPPIGFMIAMTIVAVVLPRTLNHISLYFVGSTWKIA